MMLSNNEKLYMYIDKIGSVMMAGRSFLLATTFGWSDNFAVEI